jgi:hypothetical protein
MAYRQKSDYDDVRIDGYTILPAGGYVCRILKAEETQSRSGKDMLKIGFDIIEGEHANYFRDLFNERKDAASAEEKSSVKWPFNGTKWILYETSDGKTARGFKGFCTALEDSGVTVWSRDKELLIDNLKDAPVGIIFRREESEYNNKTSWRTVPWAFRSVESIRSGDFSVPEDKPLAPKDTSWQEVDTFSAAEDDIPF